MKINSLYVNGFGKLEKKEVNFSNGINIITGNNESGKSTLLDFILAMFFGLSKLKNKKNLSNYEKYTPWKTNDFSGTLDYELDNKEKYKIIRTFSRRTLKLFNNNSEDISKEFRINNNKESDFFSEQTNIDEELFLKSFCAYQEGLKLEESQQSILIQKITNLIQTGSDDTQYDKLLSNLNEKMRDEIGTNKTQNKPLQNVVQNIEKLNNKKIEIEKYKNKRIENIEIENELIYEINLNKDKLELLLEIKKIKEKEKIELEKVNIETEIEKKNDKEIEEIELEKANIERKIKEISVELQRSTPKLVKDSSFKEEWRNKKYKRFKSGNCNITSKCYC